MPPLSSTPLHYPLDALNYRRRCTCSVSIGSVPLGSEHPLRIQTMANVSTPDTEAGIAQTERVALAGADYMRFTAQGVREAECLQTIRATLDKKGYTIPLIADIHFNPQAAYEALKHVEKVRINPGNFADRKGEWSGESISDADFAHGQERVQQLFGDFLREAKRLKRAIRLGVNHGSLSERMLRRYGDTPEGMVESCLEYLRVARSLDFEDIVISMKSSNVQVMTQAVRLLVERMDEMGVHYPLHIGVTEAGEGEDGRIKSAVGIGSLLTDGLGDTLRVSLSEAPEAELPVARLLMEHIAERAAAPQLSPLCPLPYRAQMLPRNASSIAGQLYGANLLPSVLIVGKDDGTPQLPLAGGDRVGTSVEALALSSLPAILIETDSFSREKAEALNLTHQPNRLLILRASGANRVGLWRRTIALLSEMGITAPIALEAQFAPTEFLEKVQIAAATDLGTLLLEGAGSAIMLTAPHLPLSSLQALALGILQATRLRFSHTEYISCPGCGRTLYNLEGTIARIKKATSHLPNLKIGIMGCIVNGPGEMADADYGYVGGAPHKIDLYKGQKCMRRGIAEEDAVDALIALIRENGDWVEPEQGKDRQMAENK